MSSKMHLCQLNIAMMKTSLDHPSMKDFVNALDYVNGLAESHPGFVWRLKKSESENDTSTQPFGENIIANMSVWEDAKSLRDFVYKGEHKNYLLRKSEWFDKMEFYQVLWYLPVGQVPTLEDAKNRLELLKQNGPSEEAFGFAEALRARVVAS